MNKKLLFANYHFVLIGFLLLSPTHSYRELKHKKSSSGKGKGKGSDYPSFVPSATPSDLPSISKAPTTSAAPSFRPSVSHAPSISSIPSDFPSDMPSAMPSCEGKGGKGRKSSKEGKGGKGSSSKSSKKSRSGKGKGGDCRVDDEIGSEAEVAPEESGEFVFVAEGYTTVTQHFRTASAGTRKTSFVVLALALVVGATLVAFL